ncbi:hypothetical protein [Aestuariicoccus sp. MJ-SS9]|uniref:hypothetical protein n=1 Tax=Aestuariicoccus sp. MJ-SS9 TaxID=3079855 RepID=UPI002912CB2A|nr:hypothetical protein [Aestuariicoccus sp. MJ-SS9]MDU8912886.1 hypothetical protein [Aestuariicoccus sp. MJ-SS9]
MPDTTTLLIGTTKGLFLLTQEGGGWRQSGPHCDLWPINHATGDPETGRIWAAGGSDWHGAGIWRSDGTDWTLAKLTQGQADAWILAEPEVAAQLGMKPPPPAPMGDRFSAL